MLLTLSFLESHAKKITDFSRSLMIPAPQSRRLVNSLKELMLFRLNDYLTRPRKRLFIAGRRDNSLDIGTLAIFGS